LGRGLLQQSLHHIPCVDLRFERKKLCSESIETKTIDLPANTSALKKEVPVFHYERQFYTFIVTTLIFFKNNS
jgi:hypothetical protein